MVQRLADRREHSLKIVQRHFWIDRATAKVRDGPQPSGVDGVEMIADSPCDDALGLSTRVRIAGQAVHVLRVVPRAAGDRHDDARILQVPRRSDHDAGVFAGEFRFVGIVREIHPEILPNTGRAGDQPVPAAGFHPSSGRQRGIRGEEKRR